MELKLVDISKVRFAKSRLSEESAELLEAVKKIDKTMLKAVLINPNGDAKDFDGLRNRVNGRISYWRKMGYIAKEIAMGLTEDKQLAIYWRHRVRKGGRVVEGGGLENR